MTSARRRTQGERSEKTQQALVQSARDAISELGYARVTTSETARRAGVSRGAQLHHFATKQDLLLATIDYIHQQVQDEVKVIATRIQSGSHDDIRDLICEIWNRIFKEENFIPNFEMIAASRTNEALAARVRKRWVKLAASYEEIWNEALAKAGYLSPEARSLLPLTMSFLRGMALQRVAMGNDREFFSEQLDQWSDMVFHTLQQMRDQKGAAG